MRIISILTYLAIGAVFHALFVGQHFDWSSVWTWAWLFGWPVTIVAFLCVGVLIVATVALIWVGLASALDNFR